MKTKTINKILKLKFNEFLESIDNEEVKNLVKNNSIITGGSIASLLLQEDVNDFDIYFRTKEVTSKVAQYYVNKFKQTNSASRHRSGDEISLEVKEFGDRVKIVAKSSGVVSEGDRDDYHYFEGDVDPESEEANEYVNSVYENVKSRGPKYRPILITSNAISLANDVQLIIRFFGDPSDIHSNYDFAHCTNYWSSWDEQLVLRPKALECLLTKELKYEGSKYPICSVVRLRKFIKRGWTITAGEIFKMCHQISQLNLEDINVLEEQLTGVDQAYFNEVISILRKENKKNIDSTYLFSLIDKIFNEQ